MNQQSQVKFTFLGHATVRCDLPSGEVILIDPWVQNNPACPDELQNFERLDTMLITHAHFDHIGDAVELARKHQPQQVVANFETCHWLESKGVANCSAMNIGGSQAIPGGRATMVHADHSCGILDGDEILYGGTASGYMVRLDSGFTFYHAGDTGLFSDMELVGEIHQPDLAFIPIGDLFTMGPADAARACRFLGASRIVPIHWGTFPPLTGTPAELERAAGELGLECEIVTLQPGDSC